MHEERDGRGSTPEEDALLIGLMAVIAVGFILALSHAFTASDARPAQCAEYRAEMVACVEGLGR